ncbi:cell division ATP-binding protein FtsE [candidate division KSB1 bacterium]|nr:cell division ATP-binding protein FtsE [candidate division KSB1 bacterium]
MVQIHNASFRYSGGEGLELVNFNVDPGEFIFLTGDSGAGKSTILKLIYMDIFPQTGHVIVNNYNSLNIKKREIPFLRRKLGIVFQDFKLLHDRDVFANVAFALEVTGTRKRDIKRKVLRVLAEVGLNHKRNKMPRQLSGGEQQRVVIARALVNEPFILLADEPTGNLDPTATAEVMGLLERINVRGTAVLMATHNIQLIQSQNRRIVTIEKGIVK